MGYVLAIIAGIAIGWLQAHSTVAWECETHGSFYVGKNVYKCYKIEEKK